jgi:hydrogenase-4 component E
MPAEVSLEGQIVLLLEALALATAIWAVATHGNAVLIRLFALQSGLLACGTILIARVTGASHLLYAAFFTFAFKVVLTPWALTYIRKRVQDKKPLPDLLNTPSSLLACSLLTIAAHVSTLRIAHASAAFNMSGVLAVALSTMLIGFFTMVNRRAILGQIVGLLFMENGVFLAAVAMTSGMPLLMEFGAYLDVFIAIMIMGTILFKITATRAGEVEVRREP